MKATFLATLTPMLTLFLCIVIGFVIQKFKIVPENTCKVLAKLELTLQSFLLKMTVSPSKFDNYFFLSTKNGKKVPST